MTTSDKNTVEEDIGEETSETKSGWRRKLKADFVPIVAAVVLVSAVLLAIYLFTRKRRAEELQGSGAEPQLTEAEKTLNEEQRQVIEAE